MGDTEGAGTRTITNVAVILCSLFLGGVVVLAGLNATGTSTKALIQKVPAHLTASASPRPTAASASPRSTPASASPR